MLKDSRVVAVLPCVDVERAKRFYGEVLGLSLTNTEIDPDGEVAGMFFECGGGTQLLVYPRATPTTADHTAAAWLVEDIDAVADALIAKGVTLELYELPGIEFDSRGVATMGDYRGAWFKDPEGNILSVSTF